MSFILEHGAAIYDVVTVLDVYHAKMKQLVKPCNIKTILYFKKKQHIHKTYIY